MANAPVDPMMFDLDYEHGRFRPGLSEWLGLLRRAVMRRKILFLAVMIAMLGATFAYYRLKRPLYRVDAKILAARQQVLPSNFRTGADDAPSRTAWEMIHRRENLIALLRVANALDPADLPAAAAPGAAKVATEQDDPVERTVKILDRALNVAADEGTISIRLDWPDAQQAYRIVDGAVQNFIEARHVQEVTAIDEVISVLKARETKAKEQLDRVTDDVRRESVEVPVRDVAPAPVRPAAVKGPSEELIRLKTMLDAKARAIEDVEDFRRRRLADLHAQLDEKRNTYSDAHPSVIQLKQDIEALSKESTQVSGLRDEEAKLRKDYLARLAQEGVNESAVGNAVPSPASVRVAAPRPSRASSTPVEEDERVRDARFQYQQIVERVSMAQLELDAVRAAFKYRYNVIWPPQVPKDPVSPNPVKVFGAGILAALFFAAAAAALPDLRAGVIVERWQVERSLGLPVLAELNKR